MSGIHLFSVSFDAISHRQGRNKIRPSLSTHPAEASRIRQIEAPLPTVMPLYQAVQRPEK